MDTENAHRPSLLLNNVDERFLTAIATFLKVIKDEYLAPRQILNNRPCIIFVDFLENFSDTNGDNVKKLKLMYN